MSVRRPKFVLGAISILSTVAIASCSATVDSVLNGLGDGNGDRISVAGDAQEKTEVEKGNYSSNGSIKVAPGTLPPTGKPEPGHARLNAEGYYDYKDKDFVLGDPCPYYVTKRFDDHGYEVTRTSGESLIELIDESLCLVLMDRTGLDPSISIDPHSFQEKSRKSIHLRLMRFEELTFYVNPIGSETTGVCEAAIDTPEGARGIRQPWGPTSAATNSKEACEMASTRFKKFIVGVLR